MLTVGEGSGGRLVLGPGAETKKRLEMGESVLPSRRCWLISMAVIHCNGRLVVFMIHFTHSQTMDMDPDPLSP